LEAILRTLIGTRPQTQTSTVASRWLTLDQMVESQSDRLDGQTAILAPHRAPLSYARLRRHILQTREQLWDLGIRRGDVVVSVLPNGPEAASALLCVSSCAVFAPVNPNLLWSEYERLFRDLDPRLVLAPAGKAQSARRAAQTANILVVDVVPGAEAGVFRLEGKSDCRTRGAARGKRESARPEDVAYIFGTSGSTGRPKLAPRTHGKACRALALHCAASKLTPSDRCLNFSPPFHVLGLLAGLLVPLGSGGSTVWTGEFQASEFFEWLNTFRPTWFSAVPAVLAEILERERDSIRGSSLRFIRSSGAPLPAAIADRVEALFGVPVFSAYGLSEAATISSESPTSRRRGSCGRPAGEIRIVDESGQSVAAGKPGEIAVRGISVFDGYLGDPAATRQAFRDGWFHTGDIGYLDSDGFLFLTGRASEFINRGGEKIAPLEIEDVLSAHPSVAKAVTFPVPHDKLGEEVAAGVVLREGASLTAQELLEFAASKLSAYKLPAKIFFVNKLPVSATGKILRSKMREHVGWRADKNGRVPSRYRPPRDHSERRIADILAAVLSLDRVGVEDDFFELGGDSLKAVECALLIEEEFGGRAMAPGVLRWAPTVAQLAAILADPVRLERSSNVIPLQTEGKGIPLFLIEPGDEGPRIARHLGAGRPMYGVPIPLSDNPREARSIEEMARQCVHALRSFYPDGPYALVGWCAYGVIAREMARQLEQAGCEVAFVALLDARNFFLPPMSAPRRKLVRFWQRTRKACFAARYWPAGVLVTIRAMTQPQPRMPAPESTQALRRYRPEPWTGRMVHIWCATAPHGRYFDVRFGWNHLAPAGYAFHEVAGDHLTLIQEPSAGEVARILADELDRAEQHRPTASSSGSAA
jgi:oxalate---CoA ligase